MYASDIMTTTVRSCRANDGLESAAKIMWEADCGVVPVVDADGRVVGIVTDRDVAMAAFMKGQPLSQIQVSSVMSKRVHGARTDDSIESVEALMGRAQVRRVPVVDGEGRLAGIVSMSDLARHTHPSTRILGLHVSRTGDGLSNDSVVETLAAICQPHSRAG
jgi:CBS domain-containing protein